MGTFRALAFDDAGLAEASFAGHRLIVAHDLLRTSAQTVRRRSRIAELEAIAAKMVARLDARDGGKTARARRASDCGACSRFTRAGAEAEMARFLKADPRADRFSWSVDEAAVAEAQLFDGRLALITNAPDLSPTEAVARYRALADIERGFRVLKSDIEIAPVRHRLPDRIRAHAPICYLALVLYRVMRMKLKAKGHSASPRTALERAMVEPPRDYRRAKLSKDALPWTARRTRRARTRPSSASGRCRWSSIISTAMRP